MTSGHIVQQQAATAAAVAATDAATAAAAPAAPFHISQRFKFSICCTIRAKDSRCGPLFGPLYLQAAVSPYERHAPKAARQAGSQARPKAAQSQAQLLTAKCVALMLKTCQTP